MSTATAFTYRQPLPFCPSDISGAVPGGSAYIDNLTLAQVMAFAWNLETFTLTMTGSATIGSDTAAGDNTFTLSPIASAGYTHGVLNDSSMWFGDAFAYQAFGSWPAIRQPRERVCVSAQAVPGCLVDLHVDEIGTPAFLLEGGLGFWVGTDPVNPGKYRIYYDFIFGAYNGPSDSVRIEWNQHSAMFSMTNIASGTMTLGGIPFPWYCHATTGASTTGGGLSESSTSFTY